ncbi:MAG: hypothetical protein CTY31_12525 [Hyphomicrobium sp.]|nr:MAG: hypothetical protein CTY39_09385 [Hyphomicrobium sp.]PPC98584.1 MAG: hypothetical protein CTY31_12525 [Hyphomicrobium sp.]
MHRIVELLGRPAFKMIFFWDSLRSTLGALMRKSRERCRVFAFDLFLEILLGNGGDVEGGSKPNAKPKLKVIKNKIIP